MDYTKEQLSDQIGAIAKEASRFMKHRPAEAEITQKGNVSNYVTETDLAVQQYLNESLKKLIPGSEVLGEENADWDRSAKHLWIVDPIDGTSNYIRDYSTHLGKLIYYRQVLIIFFPLAHYFPPNLLIVLRYYV